MQRDFAIFKSQQICSWKNYVTARLIYFSDRLKFSVVGRLICFWKMKNRAALPNRVRLKHCRARLVIVGFGRAVSVLHPVTPPTSQSKRWWFCPWSSNSKRIESLHNSIVVHLLYLHMCYYIHIIIRNAPVMKTVDLRQFQDLSLVE